MFGAAVVVSRLHIRIASKCGSFAAAKTFEQSLSPKILQCKVQEFALSIRSFSSWRMMVTKKSVRHDGLERSSAFRRTMSVFRPKLKIPGAEPKPVETNPFKVNVKIKNNVMLYRFEKPYLYKGSMIFGTIALVGCLAMVDNVYLILCRDLFNPNKPLLTRIKEHLLPLAFIVIGAVAGPAIFLTVWLITKRTVKFIVLHKGGKTVTLVLYHPLKGESTITANVNNLSALSTRSGQKTYIPLKIRDTKLKYIVDKNGFFVNPELFDVTVGIQRFN